MASALENYVNNVRTKSSEGGLQCTARDGSDHAPFRNVALETGKISLLQMFF